MKRNLLQGIALMSVLILGSCAAPNQLARVKNTVNDDDVYFTKAKAGDKVEDIAYNNTQQYSGDDDYYYYGDYASRLNRFANNSPFDYSDDFYFTYVPYNNGFGQDIAYADADNHDNYGYGFKRDTIKRDTSRMPIYDDYAYDPYDYGYYDLGGFDDYGYGDFYAAYIVGGAGHSHHHHHHLNIGGIRSVSPAIRGARFTATSPAMARVSPIYAGRPNVSLRDPYGIVSRATALGATGTAASRQGRDVNANYTRPMQQTNTSSTSTSSVSSGGGGASAGGSGGGRPARP